MKIIGNYILNKIEPVIAILSDPNCSQKEFEELNTPQQYIFNDSKSYLYFSYRDYLLKIHVALLNQVEFCVRNKNRQWLNPENSYIEEINK